jgi:hypothetical protein
MVSLDDYDQDVVNKAFWLQQKIYEEGLFPVGYMKKTRRLAAERSGEMVAKNIRRRLR